jgi:hypothetical protein
MDKATAQLILDRHPTRTCKHQYVVLSGQKSDKSWHGTQMICQFCLHIEDVQYAQDQRVELNNLLNIVGVPSGFQKTVDS